MPTIDVGLLVLRIVLGGIFLLHGGQKLFGWYGGGMTGVTQTMTNMGLAYPITLAWISAVSEFGGGLLIFLRLLTPLASALIIGTMLVAIISTTVNHGFFATNRGYEYNIALIGMALALVIIGGGSFSLDGLIGIAYRFDQQPVWAIVLILIVPFAGILVTEYSRRMKPVEATIP